MCMPEVDWGFLGEPKYREIVERALNHVKKLKAEGKTWEDFELHEIKATWWDVRELVYKYKVFDISYKVKVSHVLQVRCANRRG